MVSRTSHSKVPSRRVELGKTLAIRGPKNIRGMLRYGVLSEFDTSTDFTAGTPPTPVECGYLQRERLICASGDDFFHEVCQEGMFEESGADKVSHDGHTPASLRDVHVSPATALVQLSSAIEEADQAPVTHLALKLIEIVDEKGLIRGYSSFCTAATCLLAAQNALKTALMPPETLASMGVQPRVIRSAYDSVATEVSRNGDILLAILAGGGDVAEFPGVPSPSRGEESVKVIRGLPWKQSVEEMVVRGGSRPMCPAVNERYYAGQQADVAGFQSEHEVPGAKTKARLLPTITCPGETLLLPDFGYAFAYSG